MRSGHENGALRASTNGVSYANLLATVASTELGDAAVPGGAGAAWNQPPTEPSGSRPPVGARSRAVARRLTPLVGRYEIVRFLGEGRRKRVYLAFDKRLDREVAIALIKSEELSAAELAAIWRQAQTMARLSGHPNTVTVYDSGEDNQGRMYLVSEYLAGGNLAATLTQGPLPIPRGVQITTDVARALADAHAQNILHGDITPGCVWLSDHGVAKLAGFGSPGIVDKRSDVRGLARLINELIGGPPPAQLLAALAGIELDTKLLHGCLEGMPATSCTGERSRGSA